MSTVTNILVSGSLIRSEFDRLTADLPEHEEERLTIIDLGGAGGFKAMETSVYAAAVNGGYPGEIVDWFKSLHLHQATLVLQHEGYASPWIVTVYCGDVVSEVAPTWE